MIRDRASPVIQALIAALLFGASAPFAKLLLGEIEPVPLAAMLYLGSGIGLLGMKLIWQRDRPSTENEARITKPDIVWLAGAIFAGGFAAPITLLISLQKTPAATASLLLNFEGVATTLIALLVFKEAISRRAWWAIALITLSSILLSINPHAAWGLSFSALGIIVACILWGIDNNFTRNICAKDPLMIVAIKGLVAGSLSMGMAIALGNGLPGPSAVFGAMLLGCLSYGVSITLFIHAMRGLGAARTSGLFSTSPLAGMILSLLLFQEFPSWLFVAALVLMVMGTLFLVSEQHEHHHIHETAIHEHSHTHNEGHHEHEHAGEYAERHSHLHRHHESLHAHHHMPDTHHRHVHG